MRALVAGGLGQIVLCPGSRSGPLAVAAALLEGPSLQLVTALDERSAAFFALGWGRASGQPAAVITTSGTAVANLLPAVVEADFGAIPLLLITADRPAQLKGCGANQTVNQEAFLAANVRWLAQVPADGRAEGLASQALGACRGSADHPPGPVHLNVALAEPLHADGQALLAAAGALQQALFGAPAQAQPAGAAAPIAPGAGTAPSEPVGLLGLDPDRPGVVVAGPWRGLPQHWEGHGAALRRWLERTGWVLVADSLSGLRGLEGIEQVAAYDLFLDCPRPSLDGAQVLRLGPVPASRRLQRWLERCAGHQVLVSEGDPRGLDPLGRVCDQVSMGLEAWVQQLPPALWRQPPAQESLAYSGLWSQLEAQGQQLLERELGPGFSEPALARQLSRLLPAGVAVVLANSSPVRDWETFADAAGPTRPVVAFRGASGIDGTLSLACGVAEALGQAVLITGDLALLHDSHGWLWRQQLKGRLTVVLLNNNGGGIFEQLPIRIEPAHVMDFERLFAMPQAVDAIALAAAFGVPGRRPQQLADLEPDLAWALEQPLALIELITDRRLDASRRHELRRMGHAFAPPA
ncbi:MAG: 2-succinyl-5-enolpyruvyl-6-hydroxy-3-cyclohexene-1-carboxylic-acid synthase [Cyanobium sp. LacPavin_0920_WC12_MAG_62_9]|nr:2-succinyl-5-enolpyruvyl-6-hydroxy-3-cyclohexene-1-carboxylic-acid synthase [Cyanobium sp. LacPavin_0920_WC12_MAG_62_9]